MKILCYILSLCLLCLSALPCLDAQPLSSEAGQKQIAAHQQTPDACEHEAPAEDDCSPFCACQCCHFHSTLVADAFVLISTPLTDTDKDHFISMLFSKEFSSIWHPPRV